MIRMKMREEDIGLIKVDLELLKSPEKRRSRRVLTLARVDEQVSVLPFYDVDVKIFQRTSGHIHINAVDVFCEFYSHYFTCVSINIYNISLTD